MSYEPVTKDTFLWSEKARLSAAEYGVSRCVFPQRYPADGRKVEINLVETENDLFRMNGPAIVTNLIGNWIGMMWTVGIQIKETIHSPKGFLGTPYQYCV